jgi:peptidoglycan/xylan/chitin deacetylase (PgdA/CDA1 family)
MLIQSGSKIPDGQLCLTFDDGPGAHTSEISSYLREECIKATFFLIGMFVARHRDVVKQLIDDGHEVANHTHNHNHHKLTDTWNAGPQIIDAHEQLRQFIANCERPLFFRPPWGCWPTLPDLNDQLTGHTERLGDLYSGPVSWDFSGDDWSCWNSAKSNEDQQALRGAIERYAPARRGIVLMHDNSFEENIAPRNQTYRMIKGLVPMWRARGLSFVSLRDAYKRGQLDVRM